MYFNTSDKYLNKVDSWRDCPTYKSNLQTIQLLVETEWFQKLIKEARQSCKIPENGYKSKFYDPNEIGAYLIINPPEPWEWPNQVNSLEDKYLDKALKKAQLPEHFAKPLQNYLFYNYISAPILNFMVEGGCTGCSYHTASVLPQTKRFGRLDTKQREIEEETFEILTNSVRLKKPYPVLSTARIDPKKELESKMQFIKELEDIEKDIESRHSPVIDEDIATVYMQKKRINPSTKNAKKYIKLIRNARSYMATTYKEHGIPQD